MMNLILKCILVAFVINLNESQVLAFARIQNEDLVALKPHDNDTEVKLWLTISAEKRFVEISWKNAPADDDDYIFLTTKDPDNFQRTISDDEKAENIWVTNHGRNVIVAAIKPSSTFQWFTTGVSFNYGLYENITKETKCYGYWASYVNSTGDILAKNCIKAYPTWMNDQRSIIGSKCVKDLFIVGTHDAGSYREHFDPLIQENLITKYALTQDEDITNQLMHGVRYLDIRVGFYRYTSEMFFVNHGITRQMPLMTVLQQIKDFVLDTKEVVIVGFKEFPIGFKKDMQVHNLLVNMLREFFGELIVTSSIGWYSTLNEMFYRRQYVILAYDDFAVVDQHSDILFPSVEQRWGNVQKYSNLEAFLRMINGKNYRPFYRPVADMAEITPDAWGVVLDKYGGLRRLADRYNWRISQLYRDELYSNVNIVAVDFFRSTSLMDVSYEVNLRLDGSLHNN